MKDEAMKEEYDFSKAVRGQFYRADAHINLPIYLDDDVVELIEKYAASKKVDAQTAVNEILRQNKKMLQAN
jgi:HD superfamily phosphodiesterase